MPAGKLREAMALVPNEVVDRSITTGNVEQCAKRIQAFAGVADELKLARAGQRNDTGTMADYED